jgi:hypothetical protein
VSCDRVFLDLCGIFGVEYTNVSRRLYSGWGWGGGGGRLSVFCMYNVTYGGEGGPRPYAWRFVRCIYCTVRSVCKCAIVLIAGGGGGGEGLAQKTDRFL